MVGISGTIVFGVWLAISREEYQLWDGWVIAALVLWAIGGFLGQKSGEGYQAGGELGAKLAAEGATSSPELAEPFGAVAGVLAPRRDARRGRPHPRRDMIWKPGA